MANRYWVPVLGSGTGNWSDTAHWSTTSGGSGGADVPTSSDDVFIDSNSGFGSGGTITTDVTGVCHDFTSTSGHNYTIIYGDDDFYIYGSAVFEAGTTFDADSGIFTNFVSTSGGETITCNGASIYYASFAGVGGGWALQDDLVVETCFAFIAGTFDANDNNVTAKYFYFHAGTGYVPTVIMGSGIWNPNGNTDDSPYFSIWEIQEENGEVVTFNCETSTIKITDSSSATKTFMGGGKTYNNIWFTGTGTGNFIIERSNTFNDFKIDTPPHKVTFEDSTTNIVSTFTVSGTAGKLIIIDCTFGTDPFILSKSSGTVVCDYLDISNSNATGGATWYAGSHSADTTNNDGWLFEDVPAPSTTIKSKNGGLLLLNNNILNSL